MLAECSLLEPLQGFLPVDGDTPSQPISPCEGKTGPDITFFGEALPEDAFLRSQELAMRADVMVVLGTSLTVYPAAGLPRLTLRGGGRLFIVNAQATPMDELAVARYDDLAAFAAAVFGRFGEEDL